MFSAYQAEFESIASAVEELLEEAKGLGADGSDEMAGGDRNRRNMLKQAEVDLGQAESLIRQMNIEARSDPGSGLKKELASCKQRLKSLRQECIALEQSQERKDLFGDHFADSSRPMLSQQAKEDRQRFELVTARMERASETLEDSRRVLNETEDVAIGISENLSSNRSLIRGVNDRVRDTGGMMGNARNILVRMQRQETKRKLILAGLILFLLVAITLIFYSALRNSGGTAAGSGSET